MNTEATILKKYVSIDIEHIKFNQKMKITIKTVFALSFNLLFIISGIAQTTQAQKQEEKAFTKFIKKNSTKISFKNNDALDQSLNSLINSLADKKVVAIGEDTHGTSEYFKLRAIITKKLILEKGFNTIILENPYDDIELLSKKLQTTSAIELMQTHLFPIYQTEEMKAFIIWLQENPSVNITFKGCDDSYWAMHQLLETAFSKLNDSKLNDLLTQYKDQTTLELEDYVKKYPNQKQEAKNHFYLGRFAHETALKIEARLIETNTYNDRLKELLFNTKNSYINFVNYTNRRPIQARDEVMANRIKHFAKNTEAKVIVWAHSAHVSNTVIMDNEIGIMGRDLKAEFGNQYHSIGLSSLNGGYTYINRRYINDDHNYDEELYTGTLQYQPENTWEALFAKAKKGDYYFSVETLKETLKDLKINRKLKLLGYAKEDATDYYDLSPLNMFDTLIFMNTTHAPKPL